MTIEELAKLLGKPVAIIRQMFEKEKQRRLEEAERKHYNTHKDYPS